MITIFNRKELVSTFSGEERADICGQLEAADVEYAVKTVNRQGTLFGRSGGSVPQYIIYVSKKNFLLACDAM